MSDDVQRSLGEISGKLDSLIRAVETRAADDTRRFDKYDEILEKHSADINKAKGAKAVLLWGGGAVSALVATAVAEAHRLLTR